MFLCIVALVPSQAQGKPRVLTQQFSADALFTAINEKREENGLGKLQKNEWACRVAEAELKTDVAMGNGDYTSANYKDEIAQMRKQYKETATAKSDSLPFIQMEFLTYGSNLERTLYDWDHNTGKLLFLDNSYNIGCAVVQAGYGVIIVGDVEDTKTSAKQPNSRYSILL